MKKVVGKSLVLGAIALGVLSLLGGPNVFSLLKNIKFPSKSKKQENQVKEAEKTEIKEEEKIEEVTESRGTEIALEEPAKETPVEKSVQAEEPRIEEQVKVEPTPKPKPQVKAPVRKQEPVKSKPKTPKTRSFVPKKPKPAESTERVLDDGTIEVTSTNGVKTRYKNGIAVWNSTSGRLVDTDEEKAWWGGYARRKEKGSSGSEGNGVWCLTPRHKYVVSTVPDCAKDTRWGSYLASIKTH